LIELVAFGVSFSELAAMELGEIAFWSEELNWFLGGDSEK
jgi:hypothetical protein